MNAFPNWVFLQLAILLSLVAWPCATAWAQSPDLIPQEYRIKIDDIDTSLAPEITIRATFLDKKNLPVNPSKITALTVYNDDDVVSTKPKISTIKNSQVPIDLAIIVPISQRFSERELDEMKKSMSHIIEQARPKEDNVAGFFDDGRAINVAPLGNSSDVVTLLKQVKPQAQPSFLYSSLDKALETLSDPAHFRPDARRAIILVTDAFDTYTYRSHDVQREIYDAYLNARANGIRIFVVMYKPFIRGLIPSFEGLSRKTGGTYRYADFPEQIAKGIDYAWGEIYGELLITFRDSTLREGQTATYKIEATREGGMSVMSNPYREVRIDSLKFNWKAFWIGCGIVAGLLVVALIVFLIVRHQRKKREEMEAAIEEQRIQEGIERGEVCPKCRRTMMKDWTECMFCAREAAQELDKARAAQREKALADAEKKGVKLEGRICPVCNRTMMPQWKECMFCKAGIGFEGGAPKKGVAPTRSAKDKKEEPQGRICPDCGRPMKAHWTTCLYCEADAASRPQVAPKKEEPKPQDNVRICPDCGRPMKAHWTTCLYCEANRARD